MVMTNGNLDLGNVIATGVGTFTGNVAGGNISTAGILAVTGNATAGNVTGGNLVSAPFLTGTLIDGTSNVEITTNANIDLTAKGNTTVVISDWRKCRRYF